MALKAKGVLARLGTMYGVLTRTRALLRYTPSYAPPSLLPRP